MIRGVHPVCKVFFVCASNGVLSLRKYTNYFLGTDCLKITPTSVRLKKTFVFLDSLLLLFHYLNFLFQL